MSDITGAVPVCAPHTLDAREEQALAGLEELALAGLEELALPGLDESDS